MYSWFYYPAEEYIQAEKSIIFYLDKRCKIMIDKTLTEGEKKIKIDRINFVVDAIKYKYNIKNNL
mgnify:CR=1 FL=1|tara:strand:- start:2006 stop:2200 length:195 start_codon:yes stop_codon:yes gene_type:complete